MSRTPNDNRSDTMNPNNDAYAADQENRYGDDVPWGDGDDAPRLERLPRSDSRFGPDPHPILGKRSNRLPALYRNFGDKLPKIPEVVPWTEALAVAFSTEESEARDRGLAIDELMRVAHWILEQAHEVIRRQGNVSTIEKSGEDLEAAVTLTYGDHLGIHVRASKEFEVVFVEQINAEAKRERGVFRFSSLRWHKAEPKRRGLGHWSHASPHTEEQKAERAEAHRHAQDVVAYSSAAYSRGADPDPAQLIVNCVREWATR